MGVLLFWGTKNILDKLDSSERPVRIYVSMPGILQMMPMACLRDIGTSNDCMLKRRTAILV